jgi:hypothetical protein
MLAAVKFHNQASIRTDEIGDVSTHFMLTSELPTLQTPTTKMMPKPLLGVRLAGAQRPGAIYV